MAKKSSARSSVPSSPLTAAIASPGLEHALRALEAVLPARPSRPTAARRRELALLRRVTADAIRDAAELATANGFTEFDVEAAHAAIAIERTTLPVVDRFRLLADGLEMLVLEGRERPSNQTLALREALHGLARMSGNQLLLPAIDRMKGKIHGSRRRKTAATPEALPATPVVPKKGPTEPLSDRLASFPAPPKAAGVPKTQCRTHHPRGWIRPAESGPFVFCGREAREARER